MPAKSQAVSSDEPNSINIDQLPPLPSSLMSIDPVGFDRYEEDRKEWWSRVLRQSSETPTPQSGSSVWTTGGIPKGGSDGDFHYRTDTNTIYYNKRGTWRALAPLSADGDSSSINHFHINNDNNPHRVTALHVGLGNVDNTSDDTKPISTATQTALDGKASSSHTHTEYSLTSHTHTQYSPTSHTHTQYSPTSHTHTNATTSVSGFMSSSDKTKLDGISGSGGGTSTGWSTISASTASGVSTLTLSWNPSTYSMVKVFIGDLSGGSGADFRARFNYDNSTSSGAWANTVGGYINKTSGTGTLSNMMNGGVLSQYVDLYCPVVTGADRVLEFTTYPWSSGTTKSIKYMGHTQDGDATLSGFLKPAGYGPPQKIEISTSTGTFDCAYRVIGLP